MEKSFIMRFDGVKAKVGNVRIQNLHLDVKPSSTVLIKTKYPEEIAALICGDVIPFTGTISLAGVNVTERNTAERRVSRIASDVPAQKIEKLLKDALTTDTSVSTVYEQRRDELKDRERELKKGGRLSAEDKEEVKKLRIAAIATGLKMKRRQSELELNLKAAKALLADLKKQKVDMGEHIKKLEAKVFSAQLEYCTYMHRQLPDKMITERISQVISDLGLSDSSTETELRFACAYAKAPLVCVCTDTLDMAAISNLCKSTGISVCCISDFSSAADCDYTVEINNTHFTEIEGE